jgi:hypothetical protein
MKRLKLLMALPITVLAACATNKELVPTGGSRADGVVDLSFEFGGFEQPVVNRDQGLVAARARCAAWGYADAEPFGGEKRQCQFSNQYGCGRWLVTISYQCTGGAAGKS